MKQKQTNQPHALADHYFSDSRLAYLTDRRRERLLPLSHLMRTFVLIAAMVMSVGNVWGQTTKTYTFNTVTGATATTGDGNSKTLTYTQNDNSIPITYTNSSALADGGNSGFSGIKFKANTTYTITFPENEIVRKIKFVGYANNTDKSPTYISKINGGDKSTESNVDGKQFPLKGSESQNTGTYEVYFYSTLKNSVSFELLASETILQITVETDAYDGVITGPYSTPVNLSLGSGMQQFEETGSTCQTCPLSVEVGDVNIVTASIKDNHILQLTPVAAGETTVTLKQVDGEVVKAKPVTFTVKVTASGYTVSVSSNNDSKGTAYFTLDSDGTHQTSNSNVAANTTAHFYAQTNAENYVFSGWKLNGADDITRWNNPADATIEANTTYLAVFEDGVHISCTVEPAAAATPIAYQKGHTEWGLPTNGYIVPGTNASFSVQNLQDGYNWVGWYDGNGNLLTTSQEPYSIDNVRENKVIVAKFEAATTYSITWNTATPPTGCEAWYTLGSVDTKYRASKSNIPAGTVVHLHATDNVTDQIFATWYYDDENHWNTKDQDVTLDGNKTFAGSFCGAFYMNATTDDNCTVTVYTDASSKNNINGQKQKVWNPIKGIVYYEATPNNASYVFDGWYEGDTRVSQDNPYQKDFGESGTTDTYTLQARYTSTPKLQLELSCTNNSLNMITQNCSNPTIYYTTDGSDPTLSSTRQQFYGEIRLYNNDDYRNIKAYAVADGFENSDVKSLTTNYCYTFYLDGNGKTIYNVSTIREATTGGVKLPKAGLETTDVNGGTWKLSDNSTAPALPGNNDGYYECYVKGAANTATGNVLTQSLTGLTNGTYEVVLNVAASFTPYREHEGVTGGVTGDNLAVAFAGSQETYIPVAERSTVTMNQYSQVVFTVDVTDGNLSFGIRNNKTSGNWFVAKLVSLRKLDTSKFKEWNTDPAGTGTTTYAAGSNFDPNTYDIRLYAQWEKEYTYILNAVDGNNGNKVLDVIETGITSGKDVYYPLVIKVGGKFYRATDAETANTFKRTFTTQTTNADQIINVVYTEDPTIAGYLDVETVATGDEYCTIDSKYSRGTFGYVLGGNYAKISTIQPGVYKFYGSLSLKYKADRGIYFYNSSKQQICNLGTTSSSNPGIFSSDSKTITSQTDVYLAGWPSGSTVNQCAYLDYVYISYANGLALRESPKGNIYFANTTADALTVDVYAYNNGFVTPSYQWYSNTSDSNTSGTEISGATGATYTPPTSAAGTTYYYCVVTLGEQSVTSNTAKIEVRSAIEEDPNEGHIVHTDGTIPGSDCNWWKHFSPSYEITSGQERKFSFNVSIDDGVTQSFKNWLLVVSTAPGHNEDTNYDASFEKMVIRADGHGWNDGYNQKGVTLIRRTSAGVETTIPVTEAGVSDATFIQDMKNAHVDLKVSYSGTNVYVYAKMTNSTSNNTYFLTETSNNITAGKLYLFLTTECASVSSLSVPDASNAYSIKAVSSNAKAGLLTIKNSDGLTIPSGTYLGAGESVEVSVDLYPGYRLADWNYSGTQGTASGFKYTISSLSANTIVTANTGVSSYSFSRNDGKSVNYVITKGSSTTFYETLPTINNLNGASVQWSYRVVTDASTEFNTKSNLKVDDKVSGTITGNTVNIDSPAKTDGGSIVVTALINGTDKLTYVITMPYIGNHTYDMHNMADKAEVAADGHWSLGYEVIEGTKHKNPLTRLGDKLDGNNAAVIDETNGLYITTGAENNIGMAVTRGVTTNETNAYTIDDVRGVNLLAVTSCQVTIPQVKKDWFVKVYLDPHTGGSHASGSGSEFSVTNAKDLVGKTIDSDDVLCSTGVQWDSDKKDYKPSNFDKLSNGDAFLGCLIFRAAADGDVTLKFSSNGWNKIVRIVVANKFSSEMVLGSDASGKVVDYLRWTHNWVHRVYDDGNGGETGSGVDIEYNGDPNCHAENAYLIDHSIKETEGDVSLTEMTDVNWKSEAGVTYSSGTTKASNGVGNVKIVSNATYQGGTKAGAEWVTKGVDHRYVLNRNESWVVVGKLKVQKYPYTWDLENYNMGKGSTVSNITTNASSSSTQYGAWNGSKATNQIIKVKASGPSSDTKDDSPFYTIDDNGTKTYDIDIYKPLWSQGAQLTCGTAAIPETEGLGIAINYGLDAPLNGNTQALNNVVLDGSMLKVSGRTTMEPEQSAKNYRSYTVTIPEVTAGMYVFVRSSEKPLSATNTTEVTGQFAPYTGSDGAVVTVYQADATADVVLSLRKGMEKITYQGVTQDAVAGTKVYKIGVTDQIKSINYYGWTTESRAIAIDHNETGSFSAATKAYKVVQTPGWEQSYDVKIKGDNIKELEGDIHIPAGEGILLQNTKCTWDKSNGLSGTVATVPLFVPAVNIPSATSSDLEGNLLVASTDESKASTSISGTTVTAQEQFYTLSNYYYKVNENNVKKADNKIVSDPAFYRYIGSGATVSNKAFLKMTRSASSTGAKYDNKGFEEDDETTGIGEYIIENDVTESSNDTYYNISGQALNNVPAQRGVYIKNGKKVFVK